MWIDIKDKLPDLKKFKDGDIINKRYAEIIKYSGDYDDEVENVHGLAHYEESEPVLVKYRCYFLHDNFKIGIGILIKYQHNTILQNVENEKGKKIGLKISEYDITTGFMIYTPDFEGGNFSMIDENSIEDEETRVFEWMNLPKI
jgi:hypothetical protein